MKAKLISCFLIVALLVPTFSVTATAQELNDESRVSMSLEIPYFSLEKTVYGENLIETFESDTAKAYFRQIQTDHSYSTVAATSKQVYVKETIEKNGIISDSHLMTGREVLQYKMQSILHNLDSSAGTLAKTWVGDDSYIPNVKKLTLYLVVYKDSSRNYYAYGTADWTSNSGSGENTPSAGDDFIAITWGGNGELKCDTATVSGMYQYDNEEISFDKTKSDTYQGYCWSFPEQKKFLGLIETNYANYIDTYVKLKKTYSKYKWKETNIKMTYIHTYQSTVGSVSFEASSEQGMAASLSLSSCSKWWELAVDVPEIKY